jgi:hypothetical protein
LGLVEGIGREGAETVKLSGIHHNLIRHRAEA